MLYQKHIFVPPKVFTRISSPQILAKAVSAILHFLSTCKCSVYPPKVASSNHQRNWKQTSNSMCQCPSHSGVVFLSNYGIKMCNSLLHLLSQSFKYSSPFCSPRMIFKLKGFYYLTFKNQSEGSEIIIQRNIKCLLFLIIYLLQLKRILEDVIHQEIII